METVLIVIHLMVVLMLVGVVLLQRSEGGVLGQGGGGGFMTGRGQANAMTRATGILAGLFFATSLALTILANYTRAPKAIFDGKPPISSSSPAPAPVDPTNAVDALKQFELQRQQAPAAPAPAPAAPAPEAPKQ